jgi:hypothetical protein
MAWLWLNIAICVPIFLAVTGIPLWMVIRRPYTGPAFVTYSAQSGAPQVRPAPTATPSAAFPTGYAAAEAAAVPQTVAVAA